MIKFAEPLDIHTNPLAMTVKGFLMSRVDAATRERWIAEAKAGKRDPDDLWEDAWGLLTAWAQWDPMPAMEATLANDLPVESLRLYDIAYSAARGPFGTWNAMHSGYGAIKDFDLGKIPKALQREYWYILLEHWSDIDIGEAASYGVKFLLETEYAPRKDLIRFFGGEDVYPDEGSMIDRTFCSLRTWAVVRPQEMKEWIATLDDPALRKALTWLLNNPWGSGSE